MKNTIPLIGEEKGDIHFFLLDRVRCLLRGEYLKKKRMIYSFFPEIILSMNVWYERKQMI
jgi:hypothetical protein